MIIIIITIINCDNYCIIDMMKRDKMYLFVIKYIFSMLI